MKNELIEIVNQYIEIFPEERNRQQYLLKYLDSHTEKEAIDWNNFDGHIVASGFVYAKKEGKFLSIYHKDLKCFLYPGGHVDITDPSILDAAIREVHEETGILCFKEFQVSANTLVPIDIDTHKIGHNHRLNLPEHYHFDFRYLFLIDEITDVQIDKEESAEYRWVNLEAYKENKNCDDIIEKIEKLIKSGRI